jgi:hypothetical protein
VAWLLFDFVYDSVSEQREKVLLCLRWRDVRILLLKKSKQCHRITLHKSILIAISCSLRHEAKMKSTRFVWPFESKRGHLSKETATGQDKQQEATI